SENTKPVHGGDCGKTVAVCYSPPLEQSRDGNQPLLFEHIEAGSVAYQWEGTLLNGEEATPTRIMAEIRDATYIHFACHGTFNDENALDAGLVVAPEKGRTGTETTPDDRLATEGVTMERKSNGQHPPLSLLDIFQR